MKSNISFSDAAAHVRGEALPDRSSEADAIYPVIHRAVEVYVRRETGAGRDKQVVDKLAKRMGIPLDSMRQKLNTANRTHNFHPAQLMLLMREIDDVAILQQMASFLGYVVHPDRRTFDGDVMDALVELQVAVADLVRQAATIHQDRAKGRAEYATSNAVNGVHFHAQEVMHALQGLQRAADAMRRPAPEQQG